MLQSADFFPATIGGSGLSRYHTDFHEIEVSTEIPWNLETLVGSSPLINILIDFLILCLLSIQYIGNGNFSRVFKVLKRIDGCLYAVKHSIKQLHQDRERLFLYSFFEFWIQLSIIRLRIC